MSTTPAIWRSFTANSGFTSGNQSKPQTIGLSNGNILVVWESDTQDANGVDVFGRFFTPVGDPTGSAFQLNSAVAARDEIKPKIVALPDGGFVMAYTSQFGNPSTPPNTLVVVERFNSAGQSVSSSQVGASDGGLTNWEMIVDSAGNYTLVYERDILADAPENIDVRAVTFNFATNAPGAVQTHMAQNTSEPDHLAASAAFANGHIITLAMDRDTYGTVFEDFGRDTAEFTITDPATGNVVRNTVQFAGSEDNGGTPHDVAVLTGGQFVMLYTDYEVDSPNTTKRLFMKIGSSENDGGLQNKVAIQLPTLTHGYRDPHVVALKDGGFFVAWVDFDTNGLRGERFSAGGAAVGSDFQFATGVAAVGNFPILDRLSLTSDGRILVTYLNSGLEIGEVILDPRPDNFIFGTVNPEVLTAQVNGGFVFGSGGDDTLYGYDGDDYLGGEDGNDILIGGAGSDTLEGGPLADSLSGGTGNDIYILGSVNDGQSSASYDIVVENLNAGNDTVRVAPSTSALYGSVVSYMLPNNVENGVIEGTGFFILNGNTLDNRLTGNSGPNSLYGAAGFDILEGGAGDDGYYLDDVHSIATEAGTLVKYDDVIEGVDGGIDTIVVQPVGGFGNPTQYVLPANVENGTLFGTIAFNLTGNELSNVLTGNDGANTLRGLGGHDALIGGEGADRFRYTSVADGGDAIIDFNTEQGDKVVLERAGFGLLTTGGLTDAGVDFVQGNIARTAMPTVLAFRGDAWFDSDGTGVAAAVRLTQTGTPLWLIGATGDFNGDHTDDFLWQNIATGQTIEWLMSTTGGVGFQASLLPTNGYELAASGDFNGDHTDDFLWRNITTGQTIEWLMSPAGGIGFQAALPATNGYIPVGVADFNHDGTTDIVWKNVANSQTVEWLMSSSGGVGSQAALFNTSGWDPAAVGDFDGNGTQDFLWKNAATGQAIEWLMSTAGGIGSQAAVPNLTGWNLVESADFDGNHTDDFLWKNASSGQTVEWLSSPAGGIGQQAALSSVSGYELVASGDLDANGTSDFIWKNTANGQTIEWLTSTAGGIGFQAALPNTNGYTSVATGDFDGNGTTDILWRHDATGNVIEWLTSPSGGVGYQAFIANMAGRSVLSTGDFNGDGTTDVIWERASDGATEEWLTVLHGGGVVSHGLSGTGGVGVVHFTQDDFLVV